METRTITSHCSILSLVGCVFRNLDICADGTQELYVHAASASQATMIARQASNNFREFGILFVDQDGALASNTS